MIDPAARVTKGRPSRMVRFGEFLLTWGLPLAIGLLIGSVFARSARTTHEIRPQAESTHQPR